MSDAERQPNAPAPGAGSTPSSDHLNAVVTHTWRRHLKSLVPVTTVAVNVIVIAGVCGGLYQYLDQGAAKRTEQTIQLVNKWDEAGYKDRFERLQDSVSRSLGNLSSSEKQFMLSASSRDGERIAWNIGKNSIDNDRVKDVDEIFYFLNKLSICIEYSMCSRSASDAFLYESARSFWAYFGWFAEERRRQGYVYYGVDAERFARGELKPSIFQILQ